MSDRFPISDHCDGRRFFNPGGANIPRFVDVIRWKLSSRAQPWPKRVVIQKHRREALSGAGLRATWINHSTFLIETPQGNLITDPLFSPCCGPFGRLGPRRTHAPGLLLHELPSIHYVLLSHDHYDHCDIPTLRMLAQAHDPVAITPLGNGKLLKRAGFSRVVELDWWANHSPNPHLTVTLTPAIHWSNRISGKRLHRLWGGFYIHAGLRRIYFAGDTAYRENLFGEIAQRLGKPDLAMIPIGAYAPRWFMRNQHCDPAEALRIHIDVGAKTSLAMHWGTFRLTDEGREDPPVELQRALAGAAQTDFRVLAPGDHVTLAGL